MFSERSIYHIGPKQCDVLPADTEVVPNFFFLLLNVILEHLFALHFDTSTLGVMKDLFFCSNSHRVIAHERKSRYGVAATLRV